MPPSETRNSLNRKMRWTQGIDPAVREAARKRRPLFMDSPQAPVFKAMAALAQAMDLPVKERAIPV